MHVLLHAVPPTLQQATTDPCYQKKSLVVLIDISQSSRKDWHIVGTHTKKSMLNVVNEIKGQKRNHMKLENAYS